MKSLINSKTGAMLLVLMALSGTTAWADVDDFVLSVRDVTQPTANTIEFNLWLLDTDSTQTFEFAALQMGLLVNSSIYGTGTLTVSYSNNGSGLDAAQQFAGSIDVVSPLTGYDGKTLIRLMANLIPPVPPGAGTGTLIGTSGNGTFLAHFTITSSVSFTPNSAAGLEFCSGTAVSPLWPTVLYAYIEGNSNSLPVISGVDAIVDGDPLLNPRLPAVYDLTGGEPYCAGLGGSLTGLNGSESDATYTVYRNGFPAGTINGTGSALSFGLQPASTLTVRATNIAGTVQMNGELVITEIPLNTVSLTSGAGSNNQSVCISTAMTDITFSTTGATGIGTPLNLPAGVEALWAADVITISGTPAATGTFSYIIPLTGGCGTVAATGTITVNDLPTITVSTSPFCSADLLTYTLEVTVSSGTVTSSAGTVTDLGGNLWRISGVTAGTGVTVTVTDANTCDNSLSVTSPDCSCPVVTAPVSGGDQSYCAGESIPSLTVTVGAGETADWYSAASGGTLLLSGNTTYTPTAPGTYHAEARVTANNCVSSIRTSVILTENPLPTVTLGTLPTVCVDAAAIHLTQGSPTGGIYSGPGITDGPTGLFDPSVAGEGTHTITYTYTDGTTGCTGSATSTITVNDLPTITVSTSPFCSADLLTYTLEVTVSTGTVTSSAGTVTDLGGNLWRISGVTAGTGVTVTVTDANTCDNSLSVTSPDCSCPVVTAPVSGGDQSYCAGESIPSLTVTVGPGETADWYPEATGGTLLLAGNTTYTPSVPGTYYAEARVTDNNCVSSTRTSVILTENPLPTVTLGTLPTVCVDAAAIHLTQGSPTDGIYSGPGITDGPTGLFDPSVAGEGTHTITYTYTDGATGCTGSATSTITVNSVPTITVSTSPFCSADLLTYTLEVTVSSGTVTSSAGTVTDLGGNLWRISGVTAGTGVTVTVTDANTCANSLSVTSPDCSCPVVAAPVSGGNQSYCAGESIPSLTVTVGPGETADWYSEATGGTLLLAGHTTYTPSVPGTYYAEARVTDNNCVSSTRTSVTLTENPLPGSAGIISGPASFTPGTSGITYSVSPIAAATSYIWSYTGTGVTINGSGNSVTLDFSLSATPGTLSVFGRNSCGDGSAATLQLTSSTKTLTLTSVLLEGLYNGSGTMREVSNGFTSQFPGIADRIIVELHQSGSYSSIVYSVPNVELSLNGTATLTIPAEYSGNYYITVRHRNSIETTTSSPVSFAGISISQSFALTANVFGGNLKPSGDGHYLIYGADVNQDGIVDTGDMNDVDNGSASIMIGYNVPDANGDGLVDTSDMNMVDNNSAAIVYSRIPF